jgi:ubiquinone/menaquinone biosynthesis C-methylase UbiE
VLYREAVAAAVTDGCSVLDVGCGHADWLAPELAPARLTAGVDRDILVLRRNQTVSLRVVAAAEHLPFGDGMFDVVVAAWVFEHLDQPARALAELRRVLRVGGRLVFLTPNAWNYNTWLIRLVPNRLHGFFTRRLYGREEHDTYPVRYRVNSPRQLRRALRSAGFHSCSLLFNGDPTYTGLNDLLFSASMAVERLLDLGRLQQARVHIIGVCETDA